MPNGYVNNPEAGKACRGDCFPVVDYIYWRGLLALPSDFDRAMREASACRTATDTDSYAFFHSNPLNANEGKTAA